MKIWQLATVVWLGVIGLGGPSRAAADEKADNADRQRQMFDELDGNRDGRLTPDEIPGAQRQYFERLLRLADKDRDGALTIAEFQQGLKNQLPPAAPVEAGDPGDGRPAFDPRQMFSRLDRDNNGKLSLDEFPEVMRERMQAAFSRLGATEITAEQFAEVSQRFSPGAGGFMPRPAFLRRLDANGDGRLSRDEWKRAADLFDELDADKDGELDLRELLGGPDGMGFGRPRPPAGAEGKPEKRALAPSPASDKVAPAQPPAAEPARGTGRNRPGRYDLDGDKRISRDEAQGRLRENFDRLDTNGNGYLERDELQRAVRDRMPRKKADGVSA